MRRRVLIRVVLPLVAVSLVALSLSVRQVARGSRPDGTQEGAAPVPADPAPLRATITVEAGQDVRTIPRTLYGTNIEWIWDGQLLWDNKRSRLDPGLIDLTRQLGVSLIRFPGGGFSDFYHWKNGIGPRESRPETEHLPGESKSKHNFGTDEALEFAARVNGQLLVTVNAGTGTAEEAAEWVRYINRRMSPGPDHGRVEYWEVGNELYMKGDKATIPPEEYTRRYLEFASAMRRVDPTIKIGAIGGQNFGSHRLVDYPDWNRTVLTGAAPAIDFLAVHNAYAPVVFNASARTDVRKMYTALLAAPVLVGESLRKLANEVRALAPSRAAAIKFAVTEWGPLFHAEPGSPVVDHVKTLGSALFVASTLKQFIESPETHIANFFALTDIGFMGWIGIRDSAHLTLTSWDGQYLPKAPYFALQMYTQHFGAILVQSSASSPTFDSPAVGIVDALRDVPYLDVVASRSADAQRLYVMVVNKHFDRPMTTQMTLKGFLPKETGTAWTLNGTGIDANTGTRLVDGPSWARQVEANPNPRFSRGSSQEVGIATATLPGLAEQFEYTFPAHSVTCLELQRKTAAAVPAAHRNAAAR